MVPIVIICVLFSIEIYNSKQEILLQGVDQKLAMAARMAKAILPSDYHDLISGKDSVSKTSYIQTVNKFNHICTDMNLQYIWSNLKINNDIYFTTATSPGKNIAQQDHASFFERHNDPKAFKEVFSTMNPVIKEFHNEWGHGRMILIPFYDQQKRQYCFGASMGVEEVDNLLRKTVINVMTISALILLAGIFVCYFFARALSRPVRQLTSFAKGIATGHSAETIQAGGCKELISLGQSINTMNHSIQEKMIRLQENEERYRCLFYNNNTVMLIINPKNGDIVDANSAAVSFYGWNIEDLTARKITDINTLPKKQIFQNMQQVKQHERQYFSFQHRLSNGDVRDVEVYSGPIQLNNRKLLLSVVHDSTRRKQTEKILQEKERFQEALLNDMHTFVAVLDTSGGVIFVNNTPLKLSRLKLEDVIGKKFFDAPWWTHSDKVKNMVMQDIEQCASGKSMVHDIQIQIADGSLMWIEYSMHPIFDQHGVVQYLIPEGRDISNRKDMETRLLHAQKMEAIGTLAGGIAHDFNNVLFSMIGFLELSMEDIGQDSEVYDNLKEVLIGAHRAKKMVKQILTFSSDSGGKKKPIKIQPVVKEAIALLKTSIPSTVEIRHNMDTDCGPVLADSTKIHQLIMNLATNAYYAMRKKGGVLELNLTEEEIGSENTDLNIDPGLYLKLTVRDTGHGMKNQTLEKIFDPYFSTKGPAKGTGMGLAVVYGIIKEHDGGIKVSSEFGKGSVFHVYLPRIKRRSVEQQVALLPEAAITGTEHIMFVDDEEHIVRMMRKALERLGYKVTACTSSLKALEIFKAEPDNYDLVITDMTMPGLTGSQLGRRLKAIRPEIPVIISTGFSEMMDEDKAKNMGFSAYIMKPISKNQIAITIQKVLDREEEKS